MCGDIESEESRAEAFYDRFVDRAQAFLAALRAETTARPDDDALHAYLNALFDDRLEAAAAIDNAPAGVSGYERLSMEPLVYARLAGFMAAHQPLEDDPLRRLIEALMTGYAEGEAALSGAHSDDHAHEHTHTH